MHAQSDHSGHISQLIGKCIFVRRKQEQRPRRVSVPKADEFYRLITSTLGMNCTLHWQRVRLPPFSSIVEGELTLDEAAHEAFCQLWHLWDSGMDQV